jgi:ribulose-phosphate 3-epimerase
MTVAPTRPALERLLGGSPQASVGILTADLARLGEEVRLIEELGAELVHVDVMDGVYCPQLTVGPRFVQAIRTPLLKDVHLMVEDPLAMLEPVVAAGADLVTVHVEHVRHPHRIFQALASMANANDPGRGIVAGIGLTPSQPIGGLEPFLPVVDFVLILAIDPGWSGQAFLPATIRRLEQVRVLIAASGRPIALGVDGGITLGNVSGLAGLGLDIIVTGSAIFDGRAAAENGRRMLAAITELGPRRAVAPAGQSIGKKRTDGATGSGFVTIDGSGQLDPDGGPDVMRG